MYSGERWGPRQAEDGGVAVLHLALLAALVAARPSPPSGPLAAAECPEWPALTEARVGRCGARLARAEPARCEVVPAQQWPVAAALPGGLGWGPRGAGGCKVRGALCVRGGGGGGVA
jgi:hypothetical protein